MPDPLNSVALLRELAAADPAREFSVTLSAAEAREIASLIEQLVHEVALLRQLVHDAQDDYRQLLSEQGRSATHGPPRP